MLTGICGNNCSSTSLNATIAVSVVFDGEKLLGTCQGRWNWELREVRISPVLK